MKILWSPLAVERATEIAEYIAQDNPSASAKWVDDLFDKVKVLKSCSKTGRIVPETNREDIRELIVGNYRIIYRLEAKRIAILTIRHGKQILPVDEIKA